MPVRNVNCFAGRMGRHEKFAFRKTAVSWDRVKETDKSRGRRAGESESLEFLGHFIVVWDILRIKVYWVSQKFSVELCHHSNIRK